jgi:hypothetical protein
MSTAQPVSLDGRLREIAAPDFWRRHFPQLSINTRLGTWDRDAGALSSDVRQLYSARMLEEGYFQDRHETLVRLAPLLADAVLTCKRLDIPPAFIFLFDETWQCFFALDPMLKHFLGSGYRILPDFWTWHVDPEADESGWRPHRDKGRKSLAADGTPLSLTVWIPLMEASPQNSCMYILPANRDPVYNTEKERAWQVDLPHVRALPGQQGDFFCWNQAVLHWGSASSRFARTPRLSMALEFQRGDHEPFNRPLIEPFVNLKFEIRLKLVAKQILQYKHMYPLAPRFEQLARALLGG